MLEILRELDVDNVTRLCCSFHRTKMSFSTGWGDLLQKVRVDQFNFAFDVSLLQGKQQTKHKQQQKTHQINKRAFTAAET